MGTQVNSANNYDSKQQMVVSTVAAGAVAIDPGTLTIFIGSSVANQVEIIESLNQCRDKLRESGHPTASANAVALTQPGAGKAGVVFSNGALPTITEADVFVGYGDGYSPAASSRLFRDRIDAMLDKLLEDVLKAA